MMKEIQNCVVFPKPSQSTNNLECLFNKKQTLICYLRLFYSLKTKVLKNFFVPIMESSFIDLCDSFDKDDPSLFNVVFIFVNWWTKEKQPLWKRLFSNIVELLKAMSLTLHAHSKLKSLDYGVIKIKYMSWIHRKLDGDIFFEFPFVHHPSKHSRKL